MSHNVVEGLAIPAADRTPILTVRVRNRGRRPVQIHFLGKRTWFSTTATMLTTEKVGELPAVVEPGHAHSFIVEGQTKPYEPGSLGRLSRTYAIDGADRVHPLRERWIQHVENVLYYWPRHWLGKIRATRARRGQGR